MVSKNFEYVETVDDFNFAFENVICFNYYSKAYALHKFSQFRKL